MKLFLALLMLPLLAFADCKPNGASSISLLDANFAPFAFVDYQGYVFPTWTKVTPVPYRVQVFSPKCVKKNKARFTGTMSAVVTNASGLRVNSNVVQMTFFNGVSTVQYFDWLYGGANNISITLSNKNTTLVYTTSQFKVVVPTDVFIYSRESY